MLSELDWYKNARTGLGKIHFFVIKGNCDDSSLKLPLSQWDMWPMFPWQNCPTLFQRRMKKRGLYKRLYHVSTQKLEYRPLIRSPTCKVSHPSFSNPHTYTVRIMSQERQRRVACKCELVMNWDSHTGDAEILCTCEFGLSNFTSEYFGEYEDSQRVYMKEDLEIPGSQHKKHIHEVLKQHEHDLETKPKKIGITKYTFKKLCIGLAFGVLLVCSMASGVSGSLGRRWSIVWQPTFPKITFSELRECALDVVCATPISVPEGVHFEARELPEGMVLYRDTGLLKGPTSVDVRAKIIVLAVSPGSWFGAPGFQQSVEVRQHASRVEDTSIHQQVVDAVASASSMVLGLAGMYCLDALFA